MTIKTLYPNVRPTLDLAFAATKALDPRITFTRASTGTYVGSNGTLRTAGINEARFDHSPLTLESLGLLVEEARTNLSLYSEDFSNAYWTKIDCTITANDSTAPDGTTTADLWTNDLSAGGAINNSITKDATARTYTVTMWVKGTASLFTFTLDFGGTTNRGRAQFNLAANTVVGTTNTGNFTGTSASITAYSGGWARLTMTTTTSTGTTIRFRPFFGTGGESVYIWGAQVEEGAFPTSYIPTTTATATRAADVASITGTNFSSFYNQTEGTVFADNTNYGVSNTRIASFSDNSTSNRFMVTRGTASGGNINLFVGVGGVAQVNSLILASSLSFGLAAKVAVAVKASDFSGSVNGLAPVTQTTGSIPTTLSQLTIGNGETLGTNTFSGTIRRLTYWPRRLSNATLQALTS
jgi:hypothetical protein